MREIKNLQLLAIATLGYSSGLIQQANWIERKEFGRKIGFESPGFLDVPIMNYQLLTNDEYLSHMWGMETLAYIVMVLFITVILISWNRKPSA